MSHNEKRAHWVREGAISLTTGIVYGVTVVAVAHPFDNIKTMMQAKKGFENYSMIKTAVQIAKTDGFKGFYRGCIPPLWGIKKTSSLSKPLEYAKTKRQLGETWKLKNTFTGFKITWMRACVLMPTYFIWLDSFRRHFDSFFRNNIMGPFLVLIFIRHMTIPQRIKYIINERGGILGLYRGIAPGSLRSFIGNGTAMVVMQWLQKKVTELGLRD